MTISELDRKLRHVLEPGMRLQLVREQLLGASPEQACALLAQVLARPPQDGAAFDLLRDALLTLLCQTEPAASAEHGRTLPYDFRRDVYAIAAERRNDAVMRFLRGAAAQETLASTAQRLPLGLRDIPLGRRRSLAKGDDVQLLEQLALDPDREVIANLLRNPRLREQDVVRIAAMRPVPASTLQEIDRAARWATRPRVRVALARNPYCPVEIALKVMGTIPLTDLREMRMDPDLHPQTRSQVRAELERRKGHGTGRA